MADDPQVQYTVKELIGRLDAKLDVLLARVDGKSDITSTDALDKRLSELELDRASVRSSLMTLRFLVLGLIPVVAGIAHYTR